MHLHGRASPSNLAGAAVSLAVAIALFSRFSIHSELSRDEAIYSYGGQQLARGIPPYVSIFDPKSPMATLLSGLGVALGRLVAGAGGDLAGIRVVFFGLSCLTVLALYVLAWQLFRSVPAAVTAAVALAATRPFALDALTGPDAKTPGVLFAVLSMSLLVSRRWFWAGVAGGLAVLVWQPLVFYPLAAVVVALGTAGRDRWRAAALAVVGAAVPVVIVTAYFVAAGAVRQFLESALVFPLVGVRRGSETVATRARDIVHVVIEGYGAGGVLFWLGIGLLLVAAWRARRGLGLRESLRSPLVCVVLLTLVGNVAYALKDFQSVPDLYPFVPYPALGFAGAVAALQSALRSRAAARAGAAALAGVLVVVCVTSWTAFSRDRESNNGMRALSADACAVRRLQVPGTPLWALGDPVPLVVTGEQNPDRFIYLGSGVGPWKVAHTAGGFGGWTGQILAAHPSVIVVQGWRGNLRNRMGVWLHRNGYRPHFVGSWRVFLTPAAHARASTHGILLTPARTRRAIGPDGRRVHGPGCG